MNQSIINIAKGEEVFSSTRDFFFMDISTIATWMDRWNIDGHYSCIYVQCMYVLCEETVIGVYVHTGAFLTACSLAL